MFAPKSRALLTDSTGVRRVVVLARVGADNPDASHRDVVKVNGVSAYMVRTSAGARLTVPASQLSHGSRSEAEKVIDMSANPLARPDGAESVVIVTYSDGSRVLRDEAGHWQSNIATTLEGPDGNVLHRGPEWACRLRAMRRGLIKVNDARA